MRDRILSSWRRLKRFAEYEHTAEKQLPMALLYGWSIVDRAKGDFPAALAEAPVRLPRRPLFHF